MRFRLLAVSFLALAAFDPGRAAAQPAHVAPTEPLSPADEKKAFKLPDGFEAQLVASEPDILKPIQMSFDAKGRLWVSASTEYPFPAKDRPGKDKVFVLEDFGPDGRAKKVTCFADDLNIPIGVLPLPDCKSAIVYSVPNVWLLEDTDGDGKADKRSVILGPFGHRDTHGMVNSFTLMPDGWVYACHGFSNDSVVKAKDGSEIRMNSGNTFRFKPDGSRVEHWTFGQVNPFGMAVDPFFNLYTADCHSKPITQLIRGAYYSSFGKPNDGLGFAPDMINHDHGSTALCGLTWYDADHFPAEYRGTMFLGNVVTNRVNFDKIEFVGSTPKAVQKPDFLASADPWFRPTDIKLGPDGALYVADFYNRIIGHYEVPLTHPGRDKFRGRVWRIVWKGKDGSAPAPKMPRADWTKASVEELVADLGSRNIVVRMIATLQLIRRGEEAKKSDALNLTKTAARMPAVQLAHALWVADRLGMAKVTDLGMTHKTPLVRAHAYLVAASRETPPDRGIATNEMGFARTAVSLEYEGKYRAEGPRVRRAAVELLDSRPDVGNIYPLIDGLEKTPSADTHLRHAIRIALRDQLRDPKAWAWEAVREPRGEKYARAIADVALGVPSKESAAFLARQLPKLDAGRLPEFARHVARHGEPADVAELLTFVKTNKPDDLRRSVAMLREAERGTRERGAAPPSEMLALATDLAKRGLASGDNGTVQSAAEFAGSMKLAPAWEPLLALAKDPKRPEPQRAAAVAALAAIDPSKATPILGKLLADAAAPVTLRERTAQSLAGINRPEAQTELLNALQTAPARLASAIAAGLGGTPGGAEKLLAAIKAGKASPRLLQEQAVRQRLNASKLPNLGARIAELTKGLPSADQRLQQLLQQRRQGFASAKADPALGKQIFTKNCANCHQLGGEGAKVGPQLDGIGNRGLERLLEDVLDPSRNVDQALRSTRLALKDGQTVEGLVLREEGQVLVVADQTGKERRVPKEDVEERKVSPLSPMPANFGEVIPEADFYHLVAYLLAQRQADPKKPK